MTEGSEDGCLVRIRAQVMCRDEGTGGWVAVEGGGVANVMVGKRISSRKHESQVSEESTSRPTNGSGLHYEYYIHGKRISDDTEVLSCTIEKDFQYNKVMPTFHHWVTSERRFGLTFQTAADARAFDRGVRTAVEEILNGVGGPWYTRPVDKKGQDKDEDNIFECLELPSDSRSSSETSMVSRMKHEDVQTPILSAITLPGHKDPPLQQMMVCTKDRSSTDGEGDHCSYVQLTAVHEYTYLTGKSKAPLTRQDSGSLKKLSGDPPPLPDKKYKLGQVEARTRCRHCHLWYVESADPPDMCDVAPDRFKNCIDTVTCITCAQCAVYHSMNDPDGDFSNYPCLCGPPEESCVKRWIGLSILSIFVPCLCCYLPLNGLKRLSEAIGLHKPNRHSA